MEDYWHEMSYNKFPKFKGFEKMFYESHKEEDNLTYEEYSTYNLQDNE